MAKKLGVFAVASSLLVTSVALAAGGANQGALPGGTPAGVTKAQGWTGDHQLLWLVGGGVVVGGIVLVATGNGHGSIGGTCPLPGCTSSSSSSSSTPTTTTTTPTPPTTTTTGTN